jgi:DNA-damage-inducible protein J
VAGDREASRRAAEAIVVDERAKQRSALADRLLEPAMTATALVQARIDPEVKERAAEVLEALGMTLSDAVRILLTRTAREGALPIELTVDEAALTIGSARRSKRLSTISDRRFRMRRSRRTSRNAARRRAPSLSKVMRESRMDAGCAGRPRRDLRLCRGR